MALNEMLEFTNLETKLEQMLEVEEQQHGKRINDQIDKLVGHVNQGDFVELFNKSAADLRKLKLRTLQRIANFSFELKNAWIDETNRIMEKVNEKLKATFGEDYETNEVEMQPGASKHFDHQIHSSLINSTNGHNASLSNQEVISQSFEVNAREHLDASRSPSLQCPTPTASYFDYNWDDDDDEQNVGRSPEVNYQPDEQMEEEVREAEVREANESDAEEERNAREHLDASRSPSLQYSTPPASYFDYNWDDDDEQNVGRSPEVNYQPDERMDKEVREADESETEEREEEESDADSQSEPENDESSDQLNYKYLTPSPKIVEIKCTEPECTRMFTSFAKVRHHLKEDHSLKPYSCLVAGCSKRFDKRTEVADHTSARHGSRLMCNIPSCGDKSSRTYDTLYSHMLYRHMTGRYMCNYKGVCLKMVFIQNDLIQHRIKKNHHNVKDEDAGQSTNSSASSSNDAATNASTSNATQNSEISEAGHRNSRTSSASSSNARASSVELQNAALNATPSTSTCSSVASEPTRILRSQAHITIAERCKSQSRSKSLKQQLPIGRSSTKLYRCTFEDCTYPRQISKDKVFKHIRKDHFGLPETVSEMRRRGIQDPRDAGFFIEVIQK